MRLLQPFPFDHNLLRSVVMPLYVIASEAKQSRIQIASKGLDCFVACAPRNDGGIFNSTEKQH